MSEGNSITITSARVTEPTVCNPLYAFGCFFVPRVQHMLDCIRMYFEAELPLVQAPYTMFLFILLQKKSC